MIHRLVAFFVLIACMRYEGIRFCFMLIVAGTTFSNSSKIAHSFSERRNSAKSAVA